jgi:hypothetical protein
VPDPILMVAALVVAGLVAGVTVLIGAWPWRTPRAVRTRIGWVVGQGASWVAGCWLLGVRPHWPIREDLDRLLLIVLPAVVLVELAAVLPKVPRWLVWLTRLILVAGTAWILLYGSAYLAGSLDAGTWSLTRVLSILASLAAALGGVWLLLVPLTRRALVFSQWVCLSGTCAGAALTVMLSGYATGGQVGLPLAGALLGSATAALALPHTSRDSFSLGVGVVGLFSLLVIGRFFGELTWFHATLLLLAPLFGWLPAVPGLRRLRPWARGLIRVVVVAIIVTSVVVHAQRKFVEAFQSSSGTSPNEPTVQDYLEYSR